MADEKLIIDLGSGTTVTAIQTLPEATTSAGWLFIYAPGAGSNINDPFGSHASRVLAAQGFSVVRFQFPYQETRKRRPDSPAVLEATWQRIIDTFRPAEGKLVIGGRSMGGRIASQVVAKGVEVDALALFAYPLHPPADPARTRDQHLPALQLPTLFCSGTRDAFGTPEELAQATSLGPRSMLHLLEGADHGFSVPKASGRTRQDVWDEAIEAFVGWLS